MGDFNPNSPTLRGSEYRPTMSGGVLLNASNRGVMERFKPGAVSIDRIDTLFPVVYGNPGLGVEILDQPVQIPAGEVHHPGTDTGMTTTGWTRSTGAGTFFSHVDDQYDASDYLFNAGYLYFGQALPLMFRGNDTALTGKRIDTVTVLAVVTFLPATFSSGFVRVRAQLNLGGTNYLPTGTLVAPASGSQLLNCGTWALNPSTGLPWTQAQVNALVSTTASDEFGIVVDSGVIAPGAFRVEGLWILPNVCTENRKASFYTTGLPRSGWAERVLASVSGLSANLWYYLHIFPLLGTKSNAIYITTPIDPNVVEATDPTVTTAEHRKVSQTALASPSGVILEKTDLQVGQLLPALFEVSPTIQSQSQPYGLFIGTVVANGFVLVGQQITTAGATSYGGVRLPVAWLNAAKQPDQPLIIEVRSGAGAITGGGTLHATATLLPSMKPTAAMEDVLVPFAASWAATATTQYHLCIRSTAVNGWNVGRLDMRTDLIASGAGTIASEVQGASQGGTTDGYFENGAVNNRFDIPIVLVATPAAPAGLAATAKAAA